MLHNGHRRFQALELVTCLFTGHDQEPLRADLDVCEGPYGTLHGRHSFQAKKLTACTSLQGMVTIPCEPNSMVAEDFIARFTTDTDSRMFVVAKVQMPCSFTLRKAGCDDILFIDTHTHIL